MREHTQGAVEIIEGRVVAACGPLLSEDRAEDMQYFEYDRDDGEWIENHRDEFRLEEI